MKVHIKKILNTGFPLWRLNSLISISFYLSLAFFSNNQPKELGVCGKDAWLALEGKVYNVTAYMDYHPGGNHTVHMLRRKKLHPKLFFVSTYLFGFQRDPIPQFISPIICCFSTLYTIKSIFGKFGLRCSISFDHALHYVFNLHLYCNEYINCNPFK